MIRYRLKSSILSATSLRSIFSFLACIKHAKNFAPYNFFIPYDARKVIDKINTFLKAILWLLSLLYMWKQQHLILLGRFIFPFQMCVRMKIALNLYSPLNILFIWPLLVTTTTTSSATCYSTLHFSARCLNLQKLIAIFLMLCITLGIHVKKSRLLCCIFNEVFNTKMCSNKNSH